MGVVFTSRFPAIAAALEPKAAVVVAKTAQDVESLGKQYAAVDTGAMQNSVQAVQEAHLRWRVNVGVEYGIYVEYGTSKMAAQPFMVPAAEETRPAFEQAMGQIAS